MQKHFEAIVRYSDARVRAAMAAQILPDTKAYAVCDPTYREAFQGGFFDARGIVEAEHAARCVCVMTACLLQSESEFFASEALAYRALAASDYLGRVQHDEGLWDVAGGGFPDAAGTARCVLRLLSALRLLRAQTRTGTLAALAARLSKTARRAAFGLSESGCRTSGECLTVAAALAESAAFFEAPELRDAALPFLHAAGDAKDALDSDGIDALLSLSETLHDPALETRAIERLRALPAYLEPDGALFLPEGAGAGRPVPFTAYYMAYLSVGARRGIPEFLEFANFLMDAAERDGTAPDGLALLMEHPSLATLEHADVYARPASPVVTAGPTFARVQQAGFTATVRTGERDFLVIATEEMRLCLRLAAGFGGRRAFVPEKLSQANGAFYLEQTMEEPCDLPEAGKGGARLALTARVAVLREGVDVRFTVQGAAYAPVALAISALGMQRAAGGRFSDDAAKGGARLATGGGIQLIGTREVLDIGPTFACHGDTAGLAGNEPFPHGAYTLYLTAYTPLDRTLSFRLTRKQA